MSDRRDLALVLSSNMPFVVVETTDENQVLAMLVEIATARSARGYRPLFRWSITDGLQRLDLDLEPQRHNAEPADVLRHIRSVQGPGIYALLDFHPFFNDPVNVRLLKDIALTAAEKRISLLLISHAVSLPPELCGFAASFEITLPTAKQARAAVEGLIEAYQAEHAPARVSVDGKALDLLVRNLQGLTLADATRLARNAIYQDGAIDAHDIPAVMEAKYALLSQDGILSYEYDTAALGEIAGFNNLRVWLNRRKSAFSEHRPEGLDPPRGILLVGVQGCGKSLAAKTAAALFGLPLLRLDFGALYNKYHGETEKNLRASLRMADTMGPCVLWVDEIEKGIATGQDDSGTSRRVLGTFLTWLAERKSAVFIVATSNDISALPPELVRKGRFDEIFFVDLPQPVARADILRIHLAARGLEPANFDLPSLVAATEGCSGAEIEQGVVGALYTAHATGQGLRTENLAAEFGRTRPLSIVMAESVAALRGWARGRTVAAD
ncbi:MAG TPA: AAA family ATPase [Gammaproteobacteria bacterium]|nr:AAA family ATPase [Gammaproteobacteria bacterium]